MSDTAVYASAWKMVVDEEAKTKKQSLRIKSKQRAAPRERPRSRKHKPPARRALTTRMGPSVIKSSRV